MCIRDRTYEAKTPVGNVKVRVEEVALYPSGEKLAVGMRFVASIGNSWFDAKGWVYLTGDPVVDATAQTVRLRNIRFTRQFDNPLWSAASAMYGGEIAKAIEDAAFHDLKPDLAKASDILAKQVADSAAKQKIAVALQDQSINLRQINLSEKTLDVVVGLNALANVTIEAAGFMPSR